MSELKDKFIAAIIELESSPHISLKIMELYDIRQYVVSLERFKDQVEDDILLKKKYKAMDCKCFNAYIQFVYLCVSYFDTDRHVVDFEKYRRHSISEYDLIQFYRKNVELFGWGGYMRSWHCGEGGEGFWQNEFNVEKFRTHVIRHTDIVDKYIEHMGNDFKLSIIKQNG